MASRTTIGFREFRCCAAHCRGHMRSMRLRVTTVNDLSTGEVRSTYEYQGGTCALYLLRCGFCSGPMRNYNPRGAYVSASQRTVAWVSPDGLQVANLDEPGGRIGPQGQLYASAGWDRVECDSLQKLDRINDIRTQQKTIEAGHEVISRFDVADYDSATLRADTTQLAAIEAGVTEGDFIAPTAGVPDIIPTA